MQKHPWMRCFVGKRFGLPGSGRGWLRIGMLTLPCQIGRSGLAPKRAEGDGLTPRGILRPLRGFYRPDQTGARRALIPMQALCKTDGWCDQSGHRLYNRLVHLPFSASHEELWRKDRVYDVVIELDWNHCPRRQGRGSAIFLHLTNDKNGPTAGCIAVARNRIGQVLAGLSRKTRIICR